MSKEIQFNITYEHLWDELENDHNFRSLAVKANKARVELSDEDFKRLYKLEKRDKDTKWILNQMGMYNQSLVDALVGYISW